MLYQGRLDCLQQKFKRTTLRHVLRLLVGATPRVARAVSMAHPWDFLQSKTNPHKGRFGLCDKWTHLFGAATSVSSEYSLAYP